MSNQARRQMRDKSAAGNQNSIPKLEIWKITVTVLVSMITCVSVVAAAGIEPIAGWVVSLLKANSTPISTELAAFPPSDPPFTSTPELPCTVTQSCLAGEDWNNACIAEYNWTFYSSLDFSEIPKDGLGCYSQPILDVFYTKDNGLSILAQPNSLIASKDYGLFTELPQSGNVRAMLNLEKIDNGQIWFGVFEEPNIHSKGVLLVVPPGNIQKQTFALKNMPSEQRVEVSRIFESSSGKYNLGFKIELGSIIANVEGESMMPIPFTPRTRWLFIGYRAKLDDLNNGTANIQALFTELKIEKQ